MSDFLEFVFITIFVLGPIWFIIFVAGFVIGLGKIKKALFG